MWMVVLSGLMLVSAFQLFLDGLTGLRGGPLVRASGEPSAGVDDAAATELLMRILAMALERVDPTLVKAHAASKILVAAVLLYAVAAVASNDRRGRSGALAAAWASIAYHVSSALYSALVVRAGLLATAPQWRSQLLALQRLASDADAGRMEVLGRADTLLLVGPILVSLVGVGFGVVLLAYFGGRRGRSFYGLPPRQPRPASLTGTLTWHPERVPLRRRGQGNL
jgi:hypothetical protein